MNGGHRFLRAYGAAKCSTAAKTKTANPPNEISTCISAPVTVNSRAPSTTFSLAITVPRLNSAISAPQATVPGLDSTISTTQTNTVIFIIILIAVIAEQPIRELISSRLSNFFSSCPSTGHCVIEKDGVVAEGPVVDGKKHGHWVLRSADGLVAESPYVNGEWHGYWVLQHANGGVSEGPFVDDKKHGEWAARKPDGRVGHVTYRNGELVK
ncbi:MAG: hypothetical protein OXE47_01600 [Gammaproteobacteria bacterium]|nr:hypothetical protein [Gammaproteobacteria bacterium]